MIRRIALIVLAFALISIPMVALLISTQPHQMGASKVGYCVDKYNNLRFALDEMDKRGTLYTMDDVYDYMREETIKCVGGEYRE